MYFAQPNGAVGLRKTSSGHQTSQVEKENVVLIKVFVYSFDSH